MIKALRNFWVWLMAMALTSVPALAFADSSIHASGYLGLFILIIVIAILAGVALWAIGYWSPELSSVSPLLVKILRFIVIAIALVWILLLIVSLFGVHIT